MSEADTWLLLAERLLEALQENKAKGTLDEEAAAKVFDVVEYAEVEVAIGWEFLQDVVLLSCLLSEGEDSSLSRWARRLT